MIEIEKLFNKSHFRITLFLLGIALLARSLSTINPEYAVTILDSYGNTQQDILAYFDVNIDRYIMTMLWPLVYALANSFDRNIRVTPEFFRIIIFFHFSSLVAGLIWTYHHEEPTIENLVVNYHEAAYNEMYYSSAIVFIISVLVTLFSYIWFEKGWLIYESKEPNK